LVIVSCVHLVGVVFSFFIFIVGGSGGAAGMTVTFSSLHKLVSENKLFSKKN
jgi:hypothetical protein